MNWSYKRIRDNATIHISQDGSGHSIRVVPEDNSKQRDWSVVGGLSEEQVQRLSQEIPAADMRQLAEELVTKDLPGRP